MPSRLTISCTPHFKDDVEKPWVTQDSLTAVSIWLSPDRGLTLEDVAETIEQFVQTMPGYSSQIASCTFRSLTIRGEVITKDSLMLSAYMAGDKLHDGEPFTVQVLKIVGTGCCLILWQWNCDDVTQWSVDILCLYIYSQDPSPDYCVLLIISYTCITVLHPFSV